MGKNEITGVQKTALMHASAGPEEPPDGHEEEEWSPSSADPRRRLEYGEDNQPAFRGSFVKVPDGEEYLPKGVWRPEDNLMCEPEREA